MLTIDPNKIIAGDRRTLSKSITLIESSKAEDRQQSQQLLHHLLKHSGNSLRIGISGVPGVGKSTFIEAFGQQLIDAGHKLAVLAVDPSSPLSGGSILGDKLRMESLSKNPNAFIRPSPTSGSLGGVALKTRESILLCEAAGFNVIIIETVGVGQSEYQVASMVDFFMLLMLPNAGDDIQGIKKGIIELADALIINKADGASINMAQQTQQHYQNAINLIHPSNHTTYPVMTCSALNQHSIAPICSMLDEYFVKAKATSPNHELSAFDSKRLQQNQDWFEALIKELLERQLNSNSITHQLKNELKLAVGNGTITAYAAAAKLVERFIATASK